MVNNKLKKGFSLAEALVVMVIVAIFFAAATKVITTKPKPKAPTNPHGYYECYRDGGMKQRYVREGVETEAKSVSTCEFVPPGGIAFFNINAYSPEGCYTNFQPNINNNIKITFDGNKITISNASTEYELEANEDPDNTKAYFEAIHPDSQIYNDGSYKTGIMFSW